MQLRHLALGLLLCALIAAGWWLAVDRQVAQPERAEIAETPHESALKTAPTPLTVPASKQLERKSIESETPNVALAATDAALDFGTIVVVDADGTEHPQESGSFSLTVHEPRSDARTVSVQQGRWSDPLPEGARYSVTKIKLGGRPALLLPREEPIFAGAKAAALRCQWASPARLHVVDDDSGAELDGISLYTVSPFEALGIDEAQKTPDGAPIGVGLSSPIEIAYEPSEHDSGLPTHYARVAGFALGGIQIDPLAGGEFFLRLKPVGSLRLRVDGAQKDPRLRLLLERESGSEFKSIKEWRGEHLAGEARAVLGVDELVAGNYKVSAELGTSPAPRILAEQAFRIVGGQQSDVVLSIAGLSSVQQVEVVVTLRFGSGWSLEAFALQIYSLDVVVNHRYSTQKVPSSSMSSPVAGTWTSQPILLDVGRTRCLIDELHFASEQVVEPLGRQEIVIEVPAPGKVLARALDGSTGKSFDGARFRWGCKQEGQKAALFGEESRPQTAVGEYEFLAPCGTIEVEATFGPHLFASQVLEVGPGFNEVTLVLEADYCVEFVLREGEQLVPWSMSAGMAVQFEPLEAQTYRGTSGTTLGSGRMSHYRKVGGKYRVVFPKLPGYRQVEPFEFDFEQRETVEKIVQLVRE